MMKKLCMLLALALALTALPALAAGDALLTTPDGISGFSYVYSDGDTLYLNSYDSLYVWHPGDEAPTRYDFENPDHDNTYQTTTFLADGSLYALRVHPIEEDGEISIDSSAVCEMTLADGKASFNQLFEVDWAKLMEEGDSGIEINMPTQALSVGKKVFLIYIDTDHYGARASHLARIDLEEESLEALDGLDYLWQMTPYKDDRLLALQKEDGDEEATIRIYDPEEDDFERFARFEVGSEAVLSGLAYDEAEDAVYVSIDHEVHAIEEDADEPGEALADLPIQDPDTIYPALILNNGSYVYCGRSAAVMDLSGKSGERTSLTISDANNNGVLDMVLQPFQSSHSNVRVRVDRNQDKIDNLVENLINQDDSIDIYLLDATMPVYEGLRSRGFMAPLEGSAAISELVNAMYPNVKDALTADGHIVALPLDLESPCLGISSKALGLVGLTLNDVPATWTELLDFLPTLTDKLQDNDKVRLTYDFETVASVRSRFFNIMFATYQEYMNRTDPDMGYDTDLLRGLLQKLDAIDFEALGCLPEEDDEAELSDAEVILDGSVDCAFNMEAGAMMEPRLLGLNADIPGGMVLRLTVAFINPYTKNKDNAIAFMETLAKSLPNRVRYSLIPTLNEPVRGAAEEAALREFDENLQNLYAQLEKAEGSKRTLIQGQIDAQEELKAEAEANSWEISQKAIDWYRANADNMTVAPANWLDTESKNLIDQYCRGEVSVSEMLQRIDQKVRMMRMEGN